MLEKPLLYNVNDWDYLSPKQKNVVLKFYVDFPLYFDLTYKDIVGLSTQTHIKIWLSKVNDEFEVDRKCPDWFKLAGGDPKVWEDKYKLRTEIVDTEYATTAQGVKTASDSFEETRRNLIKNRDLKCKDYLNDVVVRISILNSTHLSTQDTIECRRIDDPVLRRIAQRKRVTALQTRIYDAYVSNPSDFKFSDFVVFDPSV